MKKLYSQLIVSLFVALGFTACDKEEMNHKQVSPVNSLYAPADNQFFNLGAKSTAVFEWEAAKAEDNGVVLYDVIFDLENGDFANPIYTVPSDGNGLKRTLTLSFSDLNKIAGMAGIQPEETGKLKWTVQSSKGINVQAPAVSRLLEVERPAGFSAPVELYITGSATEGGDNLADAIAMKQLTANTFEVYTSLKSGAYSFAERNTGSPATYYIDGNKLKAEGVTEYSGDEKVYRIQIDFTNATVDITEVESVGLWFAPDDKFLFEIPYIGNGEWEIKNAEIVFKQEGWGRDERYKFRFKVKNSAGEASDEWYGSANTDNQRPDETTAASYWYMLPVSSDRWNNSFKFHSDVDNNTNDVKVIFNNTVPAYTHSVTPN